MARPKMLMCVTIHMLGERTVRSVDDRGEVNIWGGWRGGDGKKKGEWASEMDGESKRSGERGEMESNGSAWDRRVNEAEWDGVERCCCFCQWGAEWL